MTSPQAQAVRAAYAGIVEWELATFRRFTGTGTSQTTVDYGPIRVRISGYAPSEIDGELAQFNQSIIALAEDLETKGFPLPLEKGDMIIAEDDREMTVMQPDLNSRKVGSTTIAYEIGCLGQ